MKKCLEFLDNSSCTLMLHIIVKMGHLPSIHQEAIVIMGAIQPWSEPCHFVLYQSSFIGQDIRYSVADATKKCFYCANVQSLIYWKICNSDIFQITPCVICIETCKIWRELDKQKYFLYVGPWLYMQQLLLLPNTSVLSLSYMFAIEHLVLSFMHS